jgi:SAM-dependent methyltransferase
MVPLADSPALRRLAFTLLDLGLQPQRLLGLRHLPRVVREAWRFRALLRQQPSLLEAELCWAPIFGDLTSLAGSSRSLYFLQDLLCSAFVLRQPAGTHLDIGSRVDGFVAQVAASRPLDVLDVRPLPLEAFPQIRFQQGDILQPPTELKGSYALVSSLHALEHVGLGRYGDPLAADGFERALGQAASLVQPGGLLLLSLPVARQPRHCVEFNSQRLFSHQQLLPLLRQLLPGHGLEWSFVIDAARRPLLTGADPEPALLAMRGIGVFGGAFRRPPA